VARGSEEVHVVRTFSAIFIIALLLPGSVSAVDSTWKFFEPEKTTEDSVLRVFGTPDAVNIHLKYEKFRQLKESYGSVPFPPYEFYYNRLRGDLNILKGPLGEAATADVAIEDGRVVVVEWEYAVKYKAPAETFWKRDKSFSTKVVQAITIGKKNLNGDVLSVICSTGRDGNCDSSIEVTLSKDRDNK
jgi:hypothetical protein